VSTQSNVMPESTLRSQRIAAVAIPAAKLMYWSVRRELWEIRAIYFAPVAVACVFLFGFSISILHLLVEMHAAPWLDVMRQRELFGQPYEFAEDLIMGTALIVGLLYSVDALYGERRDRSILFWKSAPVSDLTTVLSKAAIPIVILPLLAFAITVLTQWLMLMISSAVLLGSGQNVALLWSRVGSPTAGLCCSSTSCAFTGSGNRQFMRGSCWFRGGHGACRFFGLHCLR